MATGRILQFDKVRGYGFVAADDGGEDVFLHASVFEGDPEELSPGIRVAFKVMAGDRGRKAFAAHLIPDEPESEPEREPADRPQPVASALPPPLPPPAAPQTLLAPTPAGPETLDEEQMCDVLSPAEFGQELTEVLLNNIRVLTGQQIVDVRQSVLELAGKHGWVDI